MTEPSIEDAFVRESIMLLRESLLPRARTALARLSDDEVWWRPNEHSNSVGNMLLHLCGNIRQWIISGVGGMPDTRTRPYFHLLFLAIRTVEIKIFSNKYLITLATP